MVKEDGSLFPHGEDPQLARYKSLDVSRLKLVGAGKWPIEDFMDGVLWLPFREFAFLLHGEKVGGAPLPNLAAESRAEYLKLAKVWDAKSLLRLHPGPLCDGHFSRVFSAFKNDAADRQIGDRRISNSRERHFDGPSRCLPPGSLPCGLSLPRFSHCPLGSVTDRRDFYHQAMVSAERSLTNMLPFPFLREELERLDALVNYEAEENLPVERNRELIGDDLAKRRQKKKEKPPYLYVAFGSLVQGDHILVWNLLCRVTSSCWSRKAFWKRRTD